MNLTALPLSVIHRGDKWRLPLAGGALAFMVRDLSFGLVLVPHLHFARRLQNDLALLGVTVELLPEPAADSDGDDPALLRRGALWERWQTDRGLLIATPAGLVTPLKTGEGAIGLALDEPVGRERLIGWLEAQGYSRRSSVARSGEYAYRGAVVDLFDPTAKTALRVEFFDEEIAGLRWFNPRTQRTVEQIDRVLVAPVCGGIKGTAPVDRLPQEALCLLIDPDALENSYFGFAALWDQFHSDDPLGPLGWETVIFKVGAMPRLRFCEGEGRDSGFYLPPFFKGDLASARRWIATQRESGFDVIVTSSSLRDMSKLGQGVTLAAESSLSAGFVARDERQAWLTDSELFGLSDESDDTGGDLPEYFRERLTEGQWVTHERYGLCRYLGMGSESFGGEPVETLTLLFADDKKLIIPVADLERLTPWDGDGEPVADKLGGKRWSTARAKAQEQIEREAAELLTIQARRALTPGRAFGEPGELYRHFESTFPHRETRDQLQALREIAVDMSRPFPMDRLLVGDVGHGKTEVALRAAVLAMEKGAQAAFVVPTTVLAHQHFQTAQARMADLPFRLGQLSRMVSASKTKVVKAGLADGSVDFVVGTHALFRGGLQFKDLGLLIIDEEHRFGVAHKEALKKAYPGVDVLSLSATPIPRTLSMGLRGLKDISRIGTAPASRGQVFTATGPWEERLVRQALAREFARGGQAYYLHNRVEDIDRLAWQLSQWFPDRKVAVAHGQMAQGQLESVMDRFSSGSVDLLVCTTLVESGLDVGRANTLIVDDARLLGLAQMHQIRGRVGRRRENGYAYFLYPCSEKDLPLASRERIEALDAMESDNGGYRLAVRDLEIRGAGELLGSNQSGFKNRVGYGLYYRLLRKKIDELRGLSSDSFEITSLWNPRVDQSYLTDPAERIGLYRYLAGGLSFAQADDLRASLIDRAGPLPLTVDAAIALAVARREGSSAGLRTLKVGKGSLEAVASQGQSTPQGFFRRGDSLIGPGAEVGLLALEAWMRKELNHAS